MEFISDSIARCHVAESVDADASSYDVGSPTSVKKILGEYLSRGCDNLSDLQGIFGLVASGVSVDSLKPSHSDVWNQLIRCGSFRLPVKPISYYGLGLREGLALRINLPFGLQ